MKQYKRKDHLPCKDCGSSDALAVYSDQQTHCFSCGAHHWPPEEEKGTGGTSTISTNSTIGTNPSPKEKGYSYGTSTLSTNNSLFRTYNPSVPNVRTVLNEHPLVLKDTYRNDSLDFKGSMKINLSSLVYQSRRGISKETHKYFGVGFSSEHNGFVYPYSTGDANSTGADRENMCAAKIRAADKKAFWTVGEFQKAQMFGVDRFGKASGKAVTVTEGEDDAMACFEMLGSQYPCISLKTGAQGARKDCQENFDYINSFEKIYICFDNDAPGQKAAIEAASVFNPNKVYVVELSKHKDAQEYIEKGDAKEFVRTWWNAKRHRPKGIVSSYDEVSNILSRKQADRVADYPFPTLNQMALSIRLGEVILITAKSGIGKTEIIRAIEYKILKDTDHNLAVIHLEERERRAIMGLVSYELKVPVHRPDSGVSLEEMNAAYAKLTGRDDRVYYYQHFGSEDPNTILDIIRYMVQVNECKFVFLDHITMLVTGHEGDDERKKLDYLSTQLATLTRELDFTLFLVSHVNENGQTRGSRNIENIADLWVAVDRDKEADDPEVRNIIKLMVKKNRFGSETGPAGILKFDRQTFTISEEMVPKYNCDGKNILQTKTEASEATTSLEKPVLVQEHRFRPLS